MTSCAGSAVVVFMASNLATVPRGLHRKTDVESHGLARAFDLHNDGDTLDLLFAVGPQLRLFEQDEPGTWTPTPLELPTLPAPPTDQLVVDFDHDGDLDWLVVGPFGARLLRHRLGAAGRRIGGQHGGGAGDAVDIGNDLGGGLAQRLEFVG